MNSGLLRALGQAAGQLIRSLVSRGNAPQSAPRPSSEGRVSAPQRPTGAAATAGHGAELDARQRLLEGEPSPGQLGSTATFEVDPPAKGRLTIAYAPQHDSAPDAGEIVWTWIPYEERDGRGKDRPVLVIASDGADHVFVVRLTSKSHDGERDFLSIGSGPWDSRGRESWVDIEQLYSVHVRGMRREAAVLDRKRFSTVAAALTRRYGWRSV